MDGIEFLWFYHLNNIIGMKKIIIAIISAMILTPTMANAQDTWKPKTPENKISFRFGQTSLERRGYYYTIYAKSNLTIDEGVISIFLGNGREAALKSLDELIHVAKLKSGSYKFDGVDFLFVDNYIKVTQRDSKKYFFGEGTIMDSDLDKMRKFIEQGK